MSQIPLNSIPGNAIDTNSTGQFTPPFVRFIQLMLSSINLANAAVSAQVITGAISGGTVVINQTTLFLYFASAGGLGSYSVQFPPSPTDGSVVTIKSNQAITTLTLSCPTPDSILDPVTTLAAKGFVKYTYILSLNLWVRTG